MKESVLRIAVIGPESSGKSALCEGLAEHYKTVWVIEYARNYLPKLDVPYTIRDIVEIYQSQFQQEQDMLKNANKLIFTDTEFIIAKVWCENVFGICPDEIESAIQNHPYDLYLLTAPDLPWEYDPLRENPGKGEFFFNWYESVMKERNLSYRIVKGIGAVRMQNAISFVDQILRG